MPMNQTHRARARAGRSVPVALALVLGASLSLAGGAAPAGAATGRPSQPARHQATPARKPAEPHSGKTTGPSAPSEVIDPGNIEAIARIARGYGDAKATKTESGDPVIVGDLNGVSYQLFFLDCQDKRDCKILNFYAIWNAPGVTLDQLNDWNQVKPFHKAYLSEDGLPVVELNLSAAGGVLRSQLVDAYDRFTVAVAEFQAEVIDTSL